MSNRMGTPADSEDEEHASVHLDFSKKPVIPAWVARVIEESLAIEQEDARVNGHIGFMTRALVSATMPYKDPKTKVYERRNGDLLMSILSPHGVPFGKYPRLLLSYLVTEAVTKRSNVIPLGESLAEFLMTSIGVKSTGGKQGSATRLSDQMQRLLTSQITLTHFGKGRSIEFDNISVGRRGRLDGDDMARLDKITEVDDDVISRDDLWKVPAEGSSKWNSHVELTAGFFEECTNYPVPIDRRVYKLLAEAPMAMDIYAWATFRASYIKRPTAPIPWPALQAQFGSGSPFTPQGVRDFKKAFKHNLGIVTEIYRDLNTGESDNGSGLILYPSRTHIPKLSGQSVVSAAAPPASAPSTATTEGDGPDSGDDADHDPSQSVLF